MKENLKYKQGKIDIKNRCYKNRHDCNLFNLCQPSLLRYVRNNSLDFVN